MAGDWIKLQHWTPEKQEVFDLAEMLGIDPDAVLGKLVRLWIWADQHAVDSNAASVTRALLIRLSGVTQFPDAMVKVGWLKPLGEGRFLLPNFDRHNGQTAKRRALTATRVAKSRENSGKSRENPDAECNADVTQAALQKREQKRYQRREEKRREEGEEKRENTPKPPGGPVTEVIDWPERIYRAYPKKVAKQHALLAIKRAMKSIAPEALLSIVEAYAEARSTEDPKFTPHPATWFNRGSWADDPDTWKQAHRQPDNLAGIREFLQDEGDGDVWAAFRQQQGTGGSVRGVSGDGDGKDGDEGAGGGLLRFAE